MKYVYIVVVVISIFLLVGCSKEISKDEAEQIAIKTAVNDGYKSPKLWTEFNNQTTKGYKYSKAENKDVEVWCVYLITSDHNKELYTPALIYYVHLETGKIVDKISGVD